MSRLLIWVVLSFTLHVAPAKAETDVWLFYGAGPHAFSSGVDTIAARVQRLRGVGHVTVRDYRETQSAYDEIRATPSDRKIVVGGYSCGAASALTVAGAMGSRKVAVIGIQPSLWCGRYPTTPNMVYAQDTYGLCWETGGLGCYQFPDGAQSLTLIERPGRHLKADQDPVYQRDAVLAIGAVADPSRGGPRLQRHLQQTTRVFHSRPAHLHLWEGRGWFTGE
jgi:hypothetical protein